MKRDADIGDRPQFDQHDDAGDGGGDPKGVSPAVRHQIGQSVAEAADRGHEAANAAAQKWRAAPGERAVVGERLGEAHADAGADRGGEPDEKGLPIVVRGESGGEQRRQRRYRAVHRARRAPAAHIA